MSQTAEGILGHQHWEKAVAAVDTQSSRTDAALAWAVYILKPSFLTKAGRTTGKLRRTAYLDGLRGFAALLVYILHNQFWAHEMINADAIFENAYGYNGQYYFACLPFIRTFFSGGHLAVTSFLVISGYVLSLKPLSLIQSGDLVKLGDNLGSALFRRWIRLYLPIIGTTGVFACVMHIKKFAPSNPHHEEHLSTELQKWYEEFAFFSYVFKNDGLLFSYNFHVWSIPMEFRGSIVVYTTLMALSRCTRNARLMGEFGLCVYFLYIVDGWYCALFVSGMLLCDLDLLAMNDNLPRWLKNLGQYKTVGSYTLFIISLYLGGVPSHTIDINEFYKNPGWGFLARFKANAVWNPKWFYLYWAATFMVFCVPRIFWLKRFFETWFCQYLGKISYAFYLIHGPVLWTLGDHVYAAVGMIRPTHYEDMPNWVNAFPIPTVGPLGLELSFLLPHLVLLPFTFWLAEVVTRLFDDPAVQFSQWMFQSTLEPAPAPS